jgi:hypothetical protein
MSKFYIANFCQYHIHHPESTEEDDTPLASPVLTLKLQYIKQRGHTSIATIQQ